MNRRSTGRPLRVALVIQGFHPRVGGAEQQLEQVATRLRERGVDPHVVTRRYEGMLPFERVRGVPVHRIAIPGPKPVASAAFTAGAVARIRRLKPDVIHAHELLSPTTIGVLAGALTGTPVVVKVLISGEIRYLRDERPLGRARMALFRRRVARFVTISRDIDDELERSGVPPERRRFIPNGVDTRRFAPADPERRARLREGYGIGAGPAVTYAGRLEPQKNLVHLLTSFERIRDAHPEAQLLLAGQGSQEAELRRFAGDGVRFLGTVRDVHHLLQASDVFVLPSWREGLSNSLLEAMSAGLAVVASAVGGATEVVEPQTSGLLVDPSAPDELEVALRTVAGDPDLRADLGAAARTCILERYDIDDRVEDFHALYQELTE